MPHYLLKIRRILTVLMVIAILSIGFPFIGSAAAQSETPPEPAPIDATQVPSEPLPSEPTAVPIVADPELMPDQYTAPVRWELNLDLNPELALAAQQQPADMLSPYQAAGMDASIENGALILKGAADMNQMNSVLFDDLAPDGDFLGGAVDLAISMPASGASIELSLETRITTGYYWTVLPSDGVVFRQSGESEFQTRYIASGAPAIQTIVLEPAGMGDAVLHLQYRRPFEPNENAHAQLNIYMAGPAESITIIDPTPAAPNIDMDISERGDQSAIEQLPQPKGLPAAFDWRSRGIVPAVRQQGACGSCWAFGTAGIFESALRKAGGPLMDLSEQFLVSCNKDGWNCDGGLTAHKYHYNVLGTSQSTIGAVLETSRPYTASDATCTTSYAHPYRLHNWKFVTGSEWTVPTVAQIKTAIYTYGPITAGICTGPAFLGYSGGVFQTNENICGGHTNHQIILVGWNDATSSWILRNSHGPGWGESGYMRIRYGTSRVGEGVSWVIAGATPLSPGKNINDRTPTFVWTKTPGASAYKIQVYEGGTLRHSTTVKSSACDTTTCRSTVTKPLSFGIYQWRVQAKEGLLWKPYSAWKPFSITSSTGFSSQFNGSMTGWARKAGASWNASGSVLYTYGVNGKWTSAYRTTSPYANFDYQARMYRSGGVVDGWYPASYLAVRMGSGVASADSWWYPGFLFGYTNTGQYSIWLTGDSGTTSALQSWTDSSAIVPGGWNTLRVVAQGDTYYFFINGALVRTITRAFRNVGHVGFQMYNHSGTTSTQLMVDWATLSVRANTTVAQMQVDPTQEALNKAANEAGPGGSPQGVQAP